MTANKVGEYRLRGPRIGTGLLLQVLPRIGMRLSGSGLSATIPLAFALRADSHCRNTQPVFCTLSPKKILPHRGSIFYSKIVGFACLAYHQFALIRLARIMQTHKVNAACTQLRHFNIRSCISHNELSI